MNAFLSNANQRCALWIAVGLAVFTALAYVLIARNILGVGDLQMDENQPESSISLQDVTLSAVC